MSVADVLIHSFPLPLRVVPDCMCIYREVTAEDKEGILLALQLRDCLNHNPYPRGSLTNSPFPSHTSCIYDDNFQDQFLCLGS